MCADRLTDPKATRIFLTSVDRPNEDKMSESTKTRILEAARERLLADGYAAVSTRGVADQAEVPLSQIHYHFGSKDELILALLRSENEKALDRQREMFLSQIPLWKRWDLACDFFDEDIESGYVRVLMEMTAAGWSSESIRKEINVIYGDWSGLLTEIASEAQAKGMNFGGMDPVHVSALISAAFIGAEALILSDMESDLVPFREALRRLGEEIRRAEEAI